MILAANGRVPPPSNGPGLLESLSQKTRAPCRGGGEAGGAGSATDPTSPYPGWASKKPRPGAAPVRLERNTPGGGGSSLGSRAGWEGLPPWKGGEEAWAALATIPGRYLPGRRPNTTMALTMITPFWGVA